MVPSYARADRTVRGSHGRPAMDSPRSGADKHRITLRHDNRSRVSTLSLISYLVKELIQIQSGVRLAVNYGLNRVRFPAAVRADSRIRARVSVLALKELPDSVEATYAVTIESEKSEKPACVAEWIVRYYL